MASYVAPGSQADNDQMTQNAAQYGLTADQMSALLSQYPPVYTQNTQGGQYGINSGGSYGQNPQLTNVLNSLSAAKQFNLNLGSGTMPQGAGSIPGQVSSDPMNAATNLGAAALGMPAIYNPTPGQIPAGSKGGVAQVASPTSSGSTPSISPGPWANQPSVFRAAPMPTAATGGTPTPVTPANAPGQQAPATPYATAPPAPGASVAAQPPPAPGVMDLAHTQALAHAGMAMYSHFGGDPHSATPDDIMNFHNQLLGSLGAVTGPGGGVQAAPPSAANYTSGLPAGAAIAQPAKMATGGFVPGRGSGDTVPALLTPGEYVIPKQQAAQIFGGRQPIRMAEGGFVPQTPEEARRKALSVPGSTGTSPLQQSTPLNQSQQDSSAPAAPGGQDQGQQGYWSRMVNQIQDAKANQAFNAMGSGGYSGGGGETVGDVAGGAAIPNAGVTQDLGTTGPTAANSVAAGADIASGLTSALQTAVNTYAKSIKNWQMQPQAFGKQGTPNYQNTTFQQDTST